jgi:hypothetical protein
VSVKAGVGELLFADVAAKIDPVTVNIKPLSGAKDFLVLEQNYEYDLISHAKLMDKYVGQKIKIIAPNEYNGRVDTVAATLVSAANGEVYEVNGELHLGYPGIKVLPELPANLISRPTLSWVYRSKGKGARAYGLEASYLTGGMSWNADYILSIADGAAKGGLSGWVTVRNESGAGYNGAKLKLVAGEVNTLPRERAEAAAFDFDAAEVLGYLDEGSGGFAESGVFEYHMYDLERPTDIKDSQTKQISLLEAQSVNIIKEYVTASKFAAARGEAVKQPVDAYLSFKNTKENGLGAPLPAGTVRIYADDALGSRQFVGEDRVGHTPKDEEVRLRAGEAFDIVAERTEVDFKQVTSKATEAEWKIALRNRKAEGVTVSVVESAWWHGQWEIVEASHKHVKVDAQTFRFDVAVGAGEEAVVTYKVRWTGP